MRRFLDLHVQAHLERVLRVQRYPTIASVPSSGPYATQSETPKESVAPCPRELTGENSPHLYRGKKRKNLTNKMQLGVSYTLGRLGERVCDRRLEFLAFIRWRKPL
jgi:hypothetical protein